MNGIIATLLVTLFSVTVGISQAAIPMPHNPDEAVTPGDYCDRQDDDFVGYRYKEKIAFCKRNVSVERKKEIYDLYKVKPKTRKNYTIDHFIPLSIGGSNNPENLWPEHKEIKKLRADLELRIFEAVKSGQMTQEQAVAEIINSKMNPPVINEDE